MRLRVLPNRFYLEIGADRLLGLAACFLRFKIISVSQPNTIVFGF